MAQSRNTPVVPVAEGARPLSARSVMASLLLGRRSARAAGRDLVRWCGLFGIAPGTARVALHRMTAAGELRRDDGDYVLVGGLARRQQEQEASLTPRRRTWRGTWRVAIVVADARPAPERRGLPARRRARRRDRAPARRRRGRARARVPRRRGRGAARARRSAAAGRARPPAVAGRRTARRVRRVP